MNDIDNYKYLFLKKIYDELNLKEIEKNLPNKKIMPLTIEKNENYEIISHYFFLINNVNLKALNSEQLQKFHTLFSKRNEELSEAELKEVNEFMEKTYSLLLFPDVDSNYVYYGAINDKYVAPRDAIVIGLYYDAFIESEDFEIENNLADIVNYIQFELAKKINKKVAVLTYNQLTLESRFNNVETDFEK